MDRARRRSRPAGGCRRACLALGLFFLPAPRASFGGPAASLRDPETLEAAARADPSDRGLAQLAVATWLRAAGEAGGAQDWRAVTDRAERAWALYRALGGPGRARDAGAWARLGAAAKMYLAKAAAARDPQHAAALYRDSARLHPDPRAWRSAGVLAMRDEAWHQARRDFEEALRTPGVAAEVHLRLAEVLYQLGELSAAIERVEAGREAGAPAGEVAALLARLRREAGVEGGYAEAGTTHFRIRFEDIDEQAGFRRRVEEGLERAYGRVGAFLGEYPRGPVPVVVYPSKASFADASGAPSWAAALYDGKLRIPFAGRASERAEGLDRVLAHEFAHYLVERLAGPGAPAWLQEGIAQHVESDGGAPPWIPQFTARLLESHRGRDLPYTVRDLEGSFHAATGRGVRAAYATSYYLMGALIEDQGMSRIQRFMGALEAGTGVEEALDQELFLRYSRLDSLWQEFAKAELGLE